jgi:1,4-dihydroxy-2-naphthoyl-CoA synthase
MTEDAAVVAGNAYQVAFENDRVRVLELRMEPGDVTALHAHPDMVVVMVDGGQFRFGGPHSSTTPADLEIASGTMSFQPADRHTTQNTGTSAVHGFLIELKD